MIWNGGTVLAAKTIFTLSVSQMSKDFQMPVETGDALTVLAAATVAAHWEP